MVYVQTRMPSRYALRLLLASVLVVMLLAATAPAADAHEHREVGEYSFSVGFIEEPALVNEPNGLILEISRHTGEEGEAEEGEEEEGTPIEGLEETLEAEISYAAETKPLELRPLFGAPGAYTADVIPTAIGAYTFRIFGTIEGMEVDESFTSGPETFSEVEAIDELTFPAAGTDASEGDSGGATTDAQDAADSARTLAIGGIIVGLLGLAAGGAGIVMAMNARAQRSDRRSADTDWG